MEQHKDINYFGKVNFRNRNDVFGIKAEDRTRHMYVIGKTGMGKTALLQNMTVQDVINGKGVGIIDPHGDFAERILDFVPEHRIEDVIYLNPSDTEFAVGLNLLENVDEDKRHLVAIGLVSVFKKIWVDVWSARMEYLLGSALLALMEYPDSTLLDINKMLTNKGFRREVMGYVTDPIIKEFWMEQFVNWGERLAGEATVAVENKVGQFTTNPLIRNIIGQKQSTIDFRSIIDSHKILIINLSKGYIGEENSRLLGAIAITKLYLAAMERVDIAEQHRQEFVLYVDEFQNFANDSFEGILSESRKYKLSLVLAHQYIEQMDEAVRDAVFGNIGTLISFRVGATDAEYLEKEFTPAFTIEDILKLGKYQVILRLMIDGVASAPFSASTIAPFQPSHSSYRELIVNRSRSQWTLPREHITAMIESRVAHLKEKAIQQNQQGGGGGGGEQLYDAVCGKCGKDTKVVFDPSGSNREVLCRKCRKKKKRKEKLAQKRTEELEQQGQLLPANQEQAQTQEQPQPQEQVHAQDTHNQQGDEQEQGNKKKRRRRRKKKQGTTDEQQESQQPAVQYDSYEEQQKELEDNQVPAEQSVPLAEQAFVWEKARQDREEGYISLADMKEKYPPPVQKARVRTKKEALPQVDGDSYTVSRPPKEKEEKTEIDLKGLRELLQEVLEENAKKGKK